MCVSRGTARKKTAVKICQIREEEGQGWRRERERGIHMFSQAHSKRPVQATRDGNQLCPATPIASTPLPSSLPTLAYPIHFCFLFFFLQEANNFYFSGGNYKHETRNMNSFSFVCKRIFPSPRSPHLLAFLAIFPLC